MQATGLSRYADRTAAVPQTKTPSAIPPFSLFLIARLQCGGRHCIRGMRIRVKDVLDMLAGGATETEILQDYPYLEAEDIRACLEYASAQVDHAVVMVG